VSEVQQTAPIAPPAPVDPLAGMNYRVRGLLIQLDIDIYDEAGLRINRGTTDPVPLHEGEITVALAEMLAARTGRRAGFAILAPTTTAPAA